MPPVPTTRFLCSGRDRGGCGWPRNTLRRTGSHPARVVCCRVAGGVDVVSPGSVARGRRLPGTTSFPTRLCVKGVVEVVCSQLWRQPEPPRDDARSPIGCGPPTRPPGGGRLLRRPVRSRPAAQRARHGNRGRRSGGDRHRARARTRRSMSKPIAIRGRPCRGSVAVSRSVPAPDPVRTAAASRCRLGRRAGEIRAWSRRETTPPAPEPILYRPRQGARERLFP